MMMSDEFWKLAAVEGVTNIGGRGGSRTGEAGINEHRG